MRDNPGLKTIVVAGDKGKSHPVFGKNKAFLDVGGLPLIAHVLKALEEAQSIAEIYIVGPKGKLEEVLSRNLASALSKPVRVFEQSSNLYENIWNTFMETLPANQREETAKSEGGPCADSVVLVVGSDMPLLTGAEVDEFVAKCDMDEYDCVVGVTREEILQHYYPAENRAGIRLAYLHFSDGNLRQNNMFLVRPFKVHNRGYIQTMYDLRYQKEFANIARLAWEILRKEEGGWGALGNYLLLQLSLLFSRLHFGFMRDLIRRITHIDSVVKCISRLLQTRFSYACTSLGGAALDVDREHEYESIKARFSEWMNYQKQKAAEMAGRGSSL
ncbi:MAG: nucleotidyltransferase family protein [Candidatus Lindowbacteria bacterium]|nr:nucleotidyltransferase family protein [Candidatus Lindowbacteria bacterium]